MIINSCTAMDIRCMTTHLHQLKHTQLLEQLKLQTMVVWKSILLLLLLRHHLALLNTPQPLSPSLTCTINLHLLCIEAAVPTRSIIAPYVISSTTTVQRMIGEPRHHLRLYASHFCPHHPHTSISSSFSISSSCSISISMSSRVADTKEEV